MPKIGTRSLQSTLDLLLLSAAFWVAFLLRFDGVIPYLYLKRALFLWPYVILLQYLSMVLLDAPRFSWRYFGLRETNRIVLALALSSTFLLGMRLIGARLVKRLGFLQYVQIPIGVILLDFILVLLAILAARALRRLIGERREASRHSVDLAPVPTLLVGAGSAGLVVAREISGRPDLGIQAVGFVDDDQSKVGTELHGVAVRGTTSQLDRIVRETKARRAIITIANAPRHHIRQMEEACRKAGLATQTIPGIHEIISGRVNLNRFTPLSIDQLLGRRPPALNRDRLLPIIADKTILVTGAGGAIGTELCRQVASLTPARLLLVERAEPHLFAVHHGLGEEYPSLQTVPWLCDVSDGERLRSLFDETAPEVILHAAAYQNWALVEKNPHEAIANNLEGTRILADLAREKGVDRFLYLSADSAWHPDSVLSAVRRLSEIVLAALSGAGDPHFFTVRFGQVLGTSGSILSQMQAQIARGGPVTVGDPGATGHFLTIPEAATLVLEAAAVGSGGEVLLVDMGRPIELAALASELIRLNELEPGIDIEMVFSQPEAQRQTVAAPPVNLAGARPTDHPRLFRLAMERPDLERVTRQLDALRKRLAIPRPEPVKEALMRTLVEVEATLAPTP
ncbi:MAG: polysaccharide biosynthesis protein [Bradymonadales bacterium]|nr:polysaccharide biosynthesis protein [Bradymonadales bacterium]